MPSLRDRVEDIEPNLQYELDQYAARTGKRVTFSREARAHFLRFASSYEARWSGNFRDLNGAIVRMATLAPGGRISLEIVDEEIGRLKAAWRTESAGGGDDLVERAIGQKRAAELDYFDRVQLAGVLKVCRQARTISDAGRALFTASRGRKKTANDADRLRKYLARFGIAWSQLQEAFKQHTDGLS